MCKQMVDTVVFKTSNKFWDLFKKYKITPEELKKFTDAKTRNPLVPYNKRDYQYKGSGPLGQTKVGHALLHQDAYVIYKVSGKNPTVVYLYGFTSHEDSGTGNPPKQAKQQAFAKQIHSMTFDN